MATMTAVVENQEARSNNHAERIAKVETISSDLRVTMARVDESAKASESTRRWMIATFISILVLIVAVVGLSLKLKGSQ